MPGKILYWNAPFAAAYLAKWPADHTDAPCEQVFWKRGWVYELRCGLPAWAGAEEPEPRCEFHAERSPTNIRYQLEAALDVSEREARLVQAHLKGADLEAAHLVGARLGRADLERARLGYAHLEGAELHGADLRRADLEAAHLERANLSQVHLERANLSQAHLESADLRDAHLEGANLLGVHLEGTNLLTAHLGGASLEQARLGEYVVTTSGVVRTTITDLRGADLRGARLADVTWPDCVNVDESTRFGLTRDDERDVVLDGDAAVYRQLKLCFQESGLYDRAGEFFIHERRALQAARAKLSYTSPWRWPGPPKWVAARLNRRNLQDSVLYWLCGYGERPYWVVCWAALIIVVCAVAQTHFGLRNYGTGEVVGPWVLGRGSMTDLPVEFLKGLYFTAVTFVTLGYGDFAPMSGCGRFLASAEAFLGIGLTSLFMICLVRKFSR